MENLAREREQRQRFNEQYQRYLRREAEAARRRAAEEAVNTVEIDEQPSCNVTGCTTMGGRKKTRQRIRGRRKILKKKTKRRRKK